MKRNTAHCIRHRDHPYSSNVRNRETDILFRGLLNKLIIDRSAFSYVQFQNCFCVPRISSREGKKQ